MKEDNTYEYWLYSSDYWRVNGRRGRVSDYDWQKYQEWLNGNK